MAKRSYTSTGTSDSDVTSTEGIDFDLDGVKFICHGRLSAYDLAEFAGPVADGLADEEAAASDPSVLRILADFMRQVLGESTYREFTKHRRAHKTPDKVVEQIVADIMEEATGRPTVRPSTSPPGPEPTAASSAATSSSAPALETVPSQAEPIPAEVAEGGDVSFVVEPATGPEPDLPDGLKTRRVVNIGDAARTRVQPLEETGTG